MTESQELKLELDLAQSLARKAGAVILGYYKTVFHVASKIGADDREEPVTEADHAANALIIEGLAAGFPDDGILSEEVADTGRRLGLSRVWMVDPLDGTNGFIAHDDDFAVQIGLAIEGRPALGVVYEPARDLMFAASRGRGCRITRRDSAPARAEVSRNTDMRLMRLAASRSHRSSRMNRVVRELGVSEEVQRGSVGVKVGLIATQDCDLYIHLSSRTKQWDTCAPHIILEEAGGRLTDLFGEPIEYNNRDLQNRNGIVASNGASHSEVIRMLAPLLAEFGRTRV